MEMGRRDARRGGTNRFSKKQSGSGKSKKGMFKKLGLADEKLNSNKKQEMGNDFSDLEKEVSRKKTRIPKRNLKATTNGVDHASVPRKLRSAMNKRNLESVSKLSSASSKRFNRSKTGIESCKKDLFKMENQEMEDDEKEVAETLYGLAGMFTNETNKTCDQLSDEIEETSKVESSLVVEAESLEPAVSALSSDKTKLIDEIPLEQSDNHRNTKGLKQSSSVNVTDSPVRVVETKVALWPGLSSTVKPSKPSSIKLPPWMVGQAVSPSSKNEPLRLQPRKLKKCASHIYISRLIQVLQSGTSNNIHQIEQRSSELSAMVSPSKKYQNPHLLDLHTTHYPKPMQEEDMTQLALDLYNPNTTSHKQSYDFLSLSTTGAASQSHLPVLNSLPQYHHISAAYNSHLSPQTSSYQMQQISPYLASRFQTAYNANQQQQQQLQKRLWAAQYRPPTSGPSNQKRLWAAQHHHRLMAAAMSSMSHHHHHHHHNNVNRQEHHFPLIYDDSRTPLQLLCNEQS